jgi:hypothetical protein
MNTCRMVATNVVVPDEKEKEKLMELWCRQGDDKWGKCKRFETKKALGFCPDFVVPDTILSIDEIIDSFEEGN